MNLLKNFSIKNKILLGIGISFLLAMLFLLALVIYQFDDLSETNQSLIEEELLERTYDKYETLVRNRADILSKSYNLYLEEKEIQEEKMTETKIKEIISELNMSMYVDDMYFFIYDFEGNTVSLPPTPVLEGKNRLALEVNDRKLVQEMIDIVKNQGEGRLSYPYTNPSTKELETKYGYVKRIEGTKMFIGAGGYQSDYHQLLNQILVKIQSIRDKTILLLLSIFVLISLIIILIIFDISKYINKNLKKILSSFKKVEKGQLNFNLNIEAGDEFGDLASGFNQMLDKIQTLTYNDPLTGLPNLNFLENQLAQSLKKYQNTEQNIYLFTLITDNLTLVNSNYGYQKGNEVLKELYRRLSKNLNDKTTIARKNDEFIFYFSSVKDKNIIKNYAVEVLTNLSNPYEVNNNLIYLDLKLGIAVNENEETYSELIRKSRLALHFVDQKNNIKFFENKMKGELSERLKLESKLRKALGSNEFQLNYQPQLESRSNKVVGVEALIRWHHPKEGSISPGEFIPLTEETGMILELGDWVLNEALKQLKLWQDKGYNNLIMSVNIAPQQFQEENFVEKIAKFLKKYNISPECLDLEITERTVIKNIEYTVEVLNELKKLGVKISIDDFGTGYSSLEYLNRFALDKLKIDRSFVHNRSNLNIVKTIIMMGKNLDLEVVAEGVETKEELEFLITNDCNYYQGYYFSKAEPAAKVEKYFES